MTNSPKRPLRTPLFRACAFVSVRSLPSADPPSPNNILSLRIRGAAATPAMVSLFWPTPSDSSTTFGGSANFNAAQVDSEMTLPSTSLLSSDTATHGRLLPCRPGLALTDTTQLWAPSFPVPIFTGATLGPNAPTPCAEKRATHEATQILRQRIVSLLFTTGSTAAASSACNRPRHVGVARLASPQAHQKIELIKQYRNQRREGFLQ